MANTYRGETRRPAENAARSPNAGQTANELLDDDHNRVLQMFDEYQHIKADGDADRKRQLARTICAELKVHMQIEEEIYYPRVRKKSGENALLDEAIVEHGAAKELIKEIETAATDGSLFDANVKVLGEYIRHHIREERHELFKSAEEADANTPQMAEQLRRRKEELQPTTH